MPASTALEMLTAYKLKRRQNPSADKSTLFKYILWDRFDGTMVLDAELNEMAATSESLNELTLKVLAREKPTMAAGQLKQDAQKAIDHFFAMNLPD